MEIFMVAIENDTFRANEIVQWLKHLLCIQPMLVLAPALHILLCAVPRVIYEHIIRSKPRVLLGITQTTTTITKKIF